MFSQNFVELYRAPLSNFIVHSYKLFIANIEKINILSYIYLFTVQYYVNCRTDVVILIIIAVIFQYTVCDELAIQYTYVLYVPHNNNNNIKI